MHNQRARNSLKEIISLRLLKGLFRRQKEPEIFWLEEKIPHAAGWKQLTEAAGEEPTFGECEFLMVPGRFYRLMARGIDTGRLRTVWHHAELDKGPLRFIGRH